MRDRFGTGTVTPYSSPLPGIIAVWFTGVCHQRREDTHIVEYVHQTRSGWPPKANHFHTLGGGRRSIRTLGDPVAVSHGLRSARQHRSIFRNGSWRQTLSSPRRCSSRPDYVPRPRNYPAILLLLCRRRRCAATVPRRTSNFAPFVCNRRAWLFPNWTFVQSIV